MPNKKKGQFSVDDIEPSGGAFSEADLQPAQAADTSPVASTPAGPTGLAALIDKAKKSWHTHTDPLPSDGTLTTGAYNYVRSTARALGGTVDQVIHPENAFGSGDPNAGYDMKKPIEINTPSGMDIAGGLTAAALVGGATHALSLPPLADDIEPMTPHQKAAEGVMKAVNPAHPAQFSSAFQSTAPEILHYAQKAGFPLDRQANLEFASAGAAQERADHYQTMKNNVKKPVYVDGQPHTIEDVDKEIRLINDQLRPGYNKDSGGATLTALADKQSLMARGDKLENILHTAIADANGLQPTVINGVPMSGADQVQALRQKIGQLRTVQDETGSRRVDRITSAGKKNEGDKSGNLGKTGLLREGFNLARGGSERIADRALAKAVDKYTSLPPLSVDPLPAIAPPPQTGVVGVTTQPQWTSTTAMPQYRQLPPLRP